ncbi:MAG TPA: hypothetical protein ENJ31_08025, partial [Anaerolineae bacterium]|nr:hypothetical protein [Anaerolineae bacterium]
MLSKSRQPRYRVWLLVVVLGALAVLLIGTTMTSRAYVTKITETTLDDFSSGEFHRTGMLDISEEGIDSIQLIPIGLVGTWVQDAQSLPISLTEHSAVAAGGHVIVMGGTDENLDSRNEVYVSRIGAGGALEPWVEQTNALPVALSGAAAVVSPTSDTESWIYVIGGVSGGGAALDTIYYTTFHHDTGVVDPWLTSSNPLSLPTYYLGATVHNGYIYVVGGYQEELPILGPTAEVYYAQIQANGDLGPWQQGPSLPGARYNTLVVAYGAGNVNTLYVMGGRSDPVAGNNDVFFADINPTDGSLTSW